MPTIACRNILKSEEGRLRHLDLLKWIAMSFVCLSHFLQRFYYPDFTSSIGFSILYSVELAIFFFVGGYLVKRCKTLKDLLLYLLKLIVTYLGPAYLFTCLSIWTLPQYADGDFGTWMNVLYRGTESFYWYFLVAVFVNAILAIGSYLSHLAIKKESLGMETLRSLIVAALASAYSGIFIYIYNAPDLGPTVLSSRMVLCYLPIAFVGFFVPTYLPYFRELQKKEAWMWSLFALSMIGYVVSLCFYPNWLSGMNGSFGTILCHVLGSLSGAIAYYILSIQLVRIPFVAPLSSLGQLSGPFYLVHVYLVRLLAAFIDRPEVFSAGSIFFVISFMLIFYLGSLALTWLLVAFPYTNLVLFFDPQVAKAVYQSLPRRKDNL